MTPTDLPSGRKPVTGDVIICSVVAIFALLLVAEWVPGLLPYSPNLRLTSPFSAIRSVGFPAVSLLIATLAVVSLLLLGKRHPYALFSVVLMWVAIVGSASYSCTRLRDTCGPRGAFSIGVIIMFGAIMVRRLSRNEPKQTRKLNQ
jgi:hypothetical protein